MLILVTSLAFFVALPSLVLGIECLLALLPLRRHSLPSKGLHDVRLAVLIPAHNEENIIAEAVLAVYEQIGSQQRVIVVADNCTDLTAERARAAGAEVWERHDLAGRGKAFAMNFAIRRLRESPPEVVVVMDADCRPGHECLGTISRLARERSQVVQAAYYMFAPKGADSVSHVSAFAVYVKNVARPRGLQRAGLPCLINGSGVAYPWEAIAPAAYPSDHLAEDYRFTTNLAEAGFFVEPCIEAEVYSVLPASRKGFVSQRTRWEQGHMMLSLIEPPRLLLAGLRNANWRPLVLMLEMLVPPLSLQVGMSFVGLIVVAALSAAISSWIPLLSFAGLSSVGVIGLLAIWIVEGRRHLSPRTALRIPVYMALKVPLYLRFFTNRQKSWERTDRDGSLDLEQITNY